MSGNHHLDAMANSSLLALPMVPTGGSPTSPIPWSWPQSQQGAVLPSHPHRDRLHWLDLFGGTETPAAPLTAAGPVQRET